MKRYIAKVRIDEISGVDKPAQTPARAVLIKRAMTEKKDFSAEERQHLADTGAAMPDGSFPIRNAEDLHNAMRAIGRASNPEAARRHIKARAKSLGLEDQLTDTYKSADGGPSTMTPEQIQALQAQLAEMQKRAERAERLASLSDVQKQHLGTLPQAQQEQFLALEPKARETEVAKAAARATESDPVVETIDGVEFRKSAGEQMIRLAKANSELRQRLEKSETEASNQRLTKRAGEELQNLPGKPEAKVALLGILEKHLPKEHQTEVAQLLKAANSGLAKAGQTLGTTENKNEGKETYPQVCERLAKQAMEKNPKLSKAEAYVEAMSNPEAIEAHSRR